MKYFIQGKEVDKETFDIEFQKELETYKPLSEYWPKKEDVKDTLAKRREFNFPICDKRYRNRSVIISEINFIACEDDVWEMSNIIMDNEYDCGDGDSLAIAVALFEAGYGKVK